MGKETEAENYIQGMLDGAYAEWQKEENNSWDYTDFKENIGEEFGKVYKLAVMFGALNYQVGNGGFSQWDFNGYSEDVNELIGLMEKGEDEVGSGKFTEVKDILENFKGVPKIVEEEEEVDCAVCEGTGVEEVYGEEDEVCLECGGDGWFTDEWSNESEVSGVLDVLDDRYYELNQDEWFEDMAKVLSVIEES